MAERSDGRCSGAQRLRAWEVPVSDTSEIEQRLLHINRLVGALYQQRSFEEALKLAEQARDLARAGLPDSHSDVSVTLNNLALVHCARGDYGAALQINQQVLSIRERSLGANHPDVAATLTRLLLTYRALGMITAAEPLAQRALSIRRRALGERHVEVATSLNNLATVHQEMGRYAEAGPLYQEALDIWIEVLGADHPDVATGLTNLAALHREAGNASAGLPVAERALDIRRRAFGDDHPDVAASLNSLALFQQALGRLTEAETCAERALTIRRQVLGDGHPDVATSLNTLADVQRSLGQYTAAIDHYRQALEIRQSIHGQQHPEVAICMNNLAVAHQAVGDYAAAAPLFEQSLDMRRRILGESHPDTATNIHGLASLYWEQGEYRSAEPLFRNALEIWRRTLGPVHPITAYALNSLAELHRATGDYAIAERLYQEALEIRQHAMGNEHPLVATSLHNLAALYQETGRLDDAEPLAWRALDMRRRLEGESHPYVAISLNGVAMLRRARGDYVSAERLMRQALAIRRETLGEDHADYIACLHNLAALLHEMARYAEAEPLQQEALNRWRQALGERHPNVAAAMRGLATTWVASRQETRALRLMEQAADVEDYLIGQVFSIASERRRMAYLDDLRRFFDAHLSLVWRRHGTDAVSVQAVAGLALRRKGIGAEALAVQRDAVLGGRYPALKPRLQQISDLRAKIANITLAGPGLATSQATHRALLAKLELEREQLESDLVTDIQDTSLSAMLSATTLGAVTEALPPGASLVEFVQFDVFDFSAVRSRREPPWGESRYIAFVLRHDRPGQAVMVDLGESHSIDTMIATYQSCVVSATDGSSRHLGSRPGSTHTSDEVGLASALRVAILDPVLDHLDGTGPIFLAPDGNLTRLPFEIMVLADGRRVIDALQVSYLGAGRDLLRMRGEPVGSTTPPLVIANPDFDLSGNGPEPEPRVDRGPDPVAMRSAGLQFTPLSGTAIEGERVGALLGVRPWDQAEALESDLRACQSPRILHIATHGFFLPSPQRDKHGLLTGQSAMALFDPAGPARLSGSALENPLLRSGLALAGANTWLRGGSLPPRAEDGILTAEDVAGLDLLDTQLVVLSACETGIGDVRVGEGVFGLRRAFALAGARTLVASVWRIPDEQTWELMVELYSRVAAGVPVAEALRQSQLAMKAKYAHPLYWGGFICQGAPGSIH